MWMNNINKLETVWQIEGGNIRFVGNVAILICKIDTQRMEPIEWSMAENANKMFMLWHN